MKKVKSAHEARLGCKALPEILAHKAYKEILDYKVQLDQQAGRQVLLVQLEILVQSDQRDQLGRRVPA